MALYRLCFPLPPVVLSLFLSFISPGFSLPASFRFLFYFTFRVKFFSFLYIPLSLCICLLGSLPPE